MSYENPRKARMLREALGYEARVPTFVDTCAALAVVGGALCLIAVSTFSMPDRHAGAAVGAVYQASAENAVPTNPHVATDAPRAPVRMPTLVAPGTASAGGWPAPADSADDATANGNVADLTY
jgi:hypothetical protein